MDRKQILREEFEDIYGQSPESLLDDDYEPAERDLEIAVAMNRDKFTSIAVIIQAEETLCDIDEEHLSDESREDIQSTKSQLRFSKKVACAKYGMPWPEIRELFLTRQYDVLDDHYSEDWGAEDLLEWDVDAVEQGGRE